MSLQEIPHEVRRLIAEAIDSIAELEGILLLRDHREQDWAAAEAGARLYVSIPVASHVLAVLTMRGFLVERDGRFRFEPRTPDLEAAVTALAHCYSRNLIGVTHLVHAKPAPSVLQFAEAFRFRKDK